MENKDVMEVMRRRRSVRTFEKTPLRPEDADKIITFARKAENPYGIPIEWRLLSASADGLSSPVIVGTDTYIAGKMKDCPHAEEAFGWTFEKIVLYAESLGIGTTWIAGTMDRRAFENAMDLQEGEVMPCVSPLGYPASKMSLRESMMRRAVKADERLDFGSLFFDGSFLVPLTPEKAGVLRLPLEMVRLAPSAVNKQPWRAVVEGDDVHFFEKKDGRMSADGWDVQKIDMGICMSHFSCAVEALSGDPVFFISDKTFELPVGVNYIASISVR